MDYRINNAIVKEDAANSTEAYELARLLLHDMRDDLPPDLDYTAIRFTLEPCDGGWDLILHNLTADQIASINP